MRVLIALIFSIILSSSTAFAEVDQAPLFNSQQADVIQIAAPETQSVALFRKRKRHKGSNKSKKRNRSMGKKFKRKNDDTLRR